MARKDASNATEGVISGKVLELGMFSDETLVNGVTYEEDVLSDAGTVEFDIIKADAAGSATEICEVSDFATAKVVRQSASITHKVTAKVGGCFATAGIAVAGQIFAMFKKAGSSMAAAYRKEVFGDVVEKSVAMVDDKLDTAQPLLDQIDALIGVYEESTGYTPDVMQLPVKAFSKLRSEWRRAGYTNDPSVNSEQFLGRPSVIQFSGLTIVQNKYLPDVAGDKVGLIYDHKGFKIITPNKVSQVNDLNVDHSQFDSERGFVYMEHKDADRFVNETRVAKFFGICVVDESVYSFKVV